VSFFGDTGSLLRSIGGVNPDITQASAPEDIVSIGGVLSIPSDAGQIVETVSSDANDTSAGSGCQIAVVEGLDTDFKLQQETFIMNGTTPVVGKKLFTRIFTCAVLTAGSGLKNAGNIDTTNAGGGTVFGRMLAGTNVIQAAFFTTPANYKKSYMTDLIVSIEKTTGAEQNAQIVVLTRFFGGVFIPSIPFSVNSDGTSTLHIPFVAPISYPPKTDLKLQVIGTNTDNISIAGCFNITMNEWSAGKVLSALSLNFFNSLKGISIYLLHRP